MALIINFGSTHDTKINMDTLPFTIAATLDTWCLDTNAVFNIILRAGSRNMRNIPPSGNDTMKIY